MEPADWSDGSDRVLGCLIGEPGRAQAPLLLLVNAGAQDASFMLPAGVWQVMLDTSDARGLGSWWGQGEIALQLPAGVLMVLAAAGAEIKLP